MNKLNKSGASGNYLQCTLVVDVARKPRTQHRCHAMCCIYLRTVWTREFQPYSVFYYPTDGN